jgi:hypothetical protein
MVSRDFRRDRPGVIEQLAPRGFEERRLDHHPQRLAIVAFGWRAPGGCRHLHGVRLGQGAAIGLFQFARRRDQVSGSGHDGLVEQSSLCLRQGGRVVAKAHDLRGAITICFRWSCLEREIHLIGIGLVRFLHRGFSYVAMTFCTLSLFTTSPSSAGMDSNVTSHFGRASRRARWAASHPFLHSR